MTIFTTDEPFGKHRQYLSAKIGVVPQANNIGTLPRGAVIQKVTVGIRTLFNGAGATIDVGRTGLANAYMATALVVPATAGTKLFMPDVAALAADTPVLVTVGGTQGATGDATVEIAYEV